MADRNLVITEALKSIPVDREGTVSMVHTVSEILTASRRAAKSSASFLRV